MLHANPIPICHEYLASNVEIYHQTNPWMLDQLDAKVSRSVATQTPMWVVGFCILIGLEALLLAMWHDNITPWPLSYHSDRSPQRVVGATILFLPFPSLPPSSCAPHEEWKGPCFHGRNLISWGTLRSSWGRKGKLEITSTTVMLSFSSIYEIVDARSIT